MSEEQKQPENPAAEEAPRARRYRNWPTSAPPTSWDQLDRAAVRAAIEDATAQGISVDDPTPDTLIATAQAESLQAWELWIWIYDGAPKLDWSGAALQRWAQHYGFGKPAAGEAGEQSEASQ